MRAIKHLSVAQLNVSRHASTIAVYIIDPSVSAVGYKSNDVKTAYNLAIWLEARRTTISEDDSGIVSYARCAGRISLTKGDVFFQHLLLSYKFGRDLHVFVCK